MKHKRNLLCRDDRSICIHVLPCANSNSFPHYEVPHLSTDELRSILPRLR